MSATTLRRINRELALCWQMGRSGESKAALGRAKRLFLLAQRAGSTEAMAASLTQIAWFCLQLGEAAHGLDCAIAGKRLWQRCGDAASQAHAGAIFAWLLLELGLSDEAFEEAEQAVLLAEACGNASVLAFALNAKASVLMYCRQEQLAAPLLARSLAIAVELDDASANALYLTNLAFCHVSQAEAAEQVGDDAVGQHWRELAIETNGEAIAVAEACGDRWSLRTALCNGAEYFALAGQVAQARDYLARWVGVLGHVGQRERVHYLYTLGELLTRTGALDQALTVCAEAVALSDATANSDNQVNAVRRLGEVYEALGDYQSALAQHKRFHALYEALVGEATRRRAHVAEMRLENSKLRARAERLADEAYRDALTGLPNRRSFDRALAALEGETFAFAILDLDLFKTINDRYSHGVGDAVLRRTAELLALPGATARQAFRLGGEEFAVLFAGLGLEEAHAQCEELRGVLADHDWSDLGAGLAVTTSIGVAACAGGSDGADILAVADRRLYVAKAAGRNRVVSVDAFEPRQAASP